MKRSKGFTLVELLVVVAIIALLVSILLPTLNRARELAKRAICQSQLNGVGKAIMIYYADSKDTFPCIATNTNGTLTFDATCSTFSPGPYAPVTTLAINPVDNLSVLVYKGNLTWKMFLCPSTGSKERVRDDTSRYGFGGVAGTSYCDYGLHIPYMTMSTTGNINKAWLSANADGGLAIMADRPPDPIMTSTNNFSPNHNKEGESVLYAGGNVKWSEDTIIGGSTTYYNRAGWGNNNIYLRDLTAADGPMLTGAAPTATLITDSIYDSVIYWRSN